MNGAKILVTRPALQTTGLIQLIESHNAEPVVFPTIEILPLARSHKITTYLSNLSHYQWLIFISTNAVNFALQANNGKISDFKQAKIASVGKATAKALENAGLKVDLVPSIGFNSEALLESPELQNIQEQTFLIIRGEGGREILADTLRQRGAKVDYLEVYKRVMPKIDNSNIIALLKQQQLAAITITSGEALHNLFAILGSTVHAELLQTPLIVISERLKHLANDLGFQQVLVSASPADTAIIDTVITVCNGDNSGRRSN